MGLFKIASVDLDEFQFVPGLYPVSSLPVKGHLDCPARIGKTFHDWGAIHGIQPYVSAAEIMLGGRDITLVGYILGDTEIECRLQVMALSDLIDTFTDLVPFEAPFGTYNILVKAPVTGEYIADQGIRVTITMREPLPDLTGAALVPAGSGPGIDGISFAQMGGFLSGITGDFRNRPAAKAAQFTAYGKEGYQVTKRGAREMVLKIYIEQPDYESFETIIRGLYQLFTAPGLRTLDLGTTTHSFFVKDGFEVHTLFDQGDFFAGIVEVKITEAGASSSTSSSWSDSDTWNDTSTWTESSTPPPSGWGDTNTWNDLQTWI